MLHGKCFPTRSYRSTKIKSTTCVLTPSSLTRCAAPVRSLARSLARPLVRSPDDLGRRLVPTTRFSFVRSSTERRLLPSRWSSCRVARHSSDSDLQAAAAAVTARHGAAPAVAAVVVVGIELTVAAIKMPPTTTTTTKPGGHVFRTRANKYGSALYYSRPRSVFQPPPLLRVNGLRCAPALLPYSSLGIQFLNSLFPPLPFPRCPWKEELLRAL